MTTHIQYTDLDLYGAIGSIVDDCLANPSIMGFIHLHKEMDDWNNFRIDLKPMMSDRFGIVTVKHHDHCSVITFDNTAMIVVAATIIGTEHDEYAKQYLPMSIRSTYFQVGVMYPSMPLLRSMEGAMRSFRDFQPRIYNVTE